MDEVQIKAATREEVIEKYQEWIITRPQLLADLHELKGEVLCCFCKPKPCHGDILVELADNFERSEIPMHYKVNDKKSSYYGKVGKLHGKTTFADGGELIILEFEGRSYGVFEPEYLEEVKI